MNQPPVLPKKSSGGKCLLYGCLTVILLLIAGALTVYFGGRYAINAVIASYTSPAPATLPRVEISDEQYAGLLSRITNFSQSLTQSAAGTSVTLTLTADELNAWLQRQQGSGGTNDHVFVQLVGDQIKGQVSLPLDELGWKKLKGRYLNGSGGFTATLTNGVLDVRIQSLTVNGNPLPPNFITQMQTENLAKNFNSDPRKPSWFHLLESVEFKDSKMTIRARPPEAKPQ
jgi:hypothetical protein